MAIWTPKSGSNSWTNAQNWDVLRAPFPTDNVTVGSAPAPLIAGGGFAHNLTISAGSVTIGGSNANMQSSLTISGSIINGGQISLNPGATNYQATLDFNVTGNFAQAQISGGGTILMSDSTHNFIVSGPNGVALANVDNTISGAGNFGNGSAIRLDNQAQGTIAATQPNNQLIINLPQKATNEGLIQASAGSAGLSIYRTTIDSSGGGTISAAGANVSLTSATLIGGTLQTGGGGIIQTLDNANVIDSVTNDGSIHVNDATTLTLKGNITNALGTITMLAGGDQTYLKVDTSGATLVGPGLITLTDSDHNVIMGSGNNSTLNNLANIISGAGVIGGNGLVVNNAGVITATGVNNALTIDTGGVLNNSGVLSATGPAGLEINNTTVNGVAGGQIIANAPNAHVGLTAAHLIGGTLSTVGAGAEIEAKGQASILDGTLTNVTNSGTVSVGADVILQVWGTIKNTGNFAIEGTAGGGASLMSGLVGATMTGGGTVTMSDLSSNSISGEGSSKFTNQDNTISGAGSFVDMTLVNQGLIEATFSDNALVLNTGNQITNNGILEANGGKLVIDNHDLVTGTGSMLITAGGTLVLNPVQEQQTVNFSGAGNLDLNQPYSGSISGFGANDIIDLSFVFSTNFGTGHNNIHANWVENNANTGGTLSIVDPSLPSQIETVATLTLAGQYTPSEFVVSDDGSGLHPKVSLAGNQGPPPPLTVAQALANPSPILLINDTFSNVAANLDALENISSAIGTITLSDATVPTLILSGSQYLKDLQVIDDISSVFNLQINLTAGADSIPAPINAATNSGGGFDAIVGDGHHDIVMFSRPSTDYSPSPTSGGDAIADAPNSPIYLLQHVEFLQFPDQTTFVENADNANIARLYSAALDRSPDVGGLSGWEDIYANNISAAVKAQGVYAALAQTNDGFGSTIAGGFAQSAEFQAKYGSLDDAGFVSQLYQNVLNRAPGASELNAWLDLMHNSGFTHDMVLVGFAESPENIAKTAGWLIQV